MRKILSERNLVVLLFVSALVIFTFAQQDINKVEHLYSPAITVMPPSPPQSASTEEIKAPKELPVTTTEKK
jgi:hypothetical protein